MSPLALLNYDESILSLSNSFLKHYGISPAFKTLPELDRALQQNKRNILFMIFDGMGTAVLKKHLASDSFLRKHLVRPIRSVFPPTTVAATTTFFSALPPAAHGWLGWMCFFKAHRAAVELFRGTNFYTHEKMEMPSTDKILPYTSVLTQIHMRAPDVQTTEIFPRMIKPDGVDNLEQMQERLQNIMQEQGRHFTLCYWTEPDASMHQKGPSSKEITPLVQSINDFVERLSKTLSETQIIVSADHGQVDVSEEIYIDDYPEMKDCLACPLSLEDRSVFIFLKPGKKETFLALFKKHFQGDFILLSKEEVLKSMIFGQNKFNPTAKEFLGDYLMISICGKSVRQRLADGEKQKAFKGSHSGLTPEEMNVPLIIV